VHLKRKVLELHPELEFCTGKSEEDIKALENALIEAWEALPDSLFESLRIDAFLNAHAEPSKHNSN
jgi:hypothetical protein